MGNVSGKLEDRPSLYLRDQTRLSLASLEITNSRKQVVARVTTNSFPSTKVLVKRDLGDDSLIEYVQDPDTNSPGPQLLFKIVNEGELYFNFTFNVRQREGPNRQLVDTNINGLTFAFAGSNRELENLVTREFHADPNLHKNPNVNLVGDYSTEGSAAVQFHWTWKWRAPTGMEERGIQGFRNVCSFVEYDQRAHKLQTLAQFSFWIQNSPRPIASPALTEFEMSIPPKLKVTSVRTREDNEDPSIELNEPPSPMDTFDSSSLASAATVVPTVKVDVSCQRPSDSVMQDDGPLFRATIKSLEQKTGALRTKMKKILKRAEQAKNAQVASNDALSGFMEALREAALSNATGIQPALDHYYERTYREILLFEKQNESNLQKLIIDPLTRLYNIDIKQADLKRKEFEEESRDYYNYVSRYLGIRNNDLKAKKKAESDSKYQQKRRNFELKRFDYCSFMQDLHGGRKEQEVLSQLTKFAETQAKSFLLTAKKVTELMPQLEALSHEVKETDKEFQLQRTEREERRRQLETSQKTYVEPDTFVPPPTPNPNAKDGGGAFGDPGRKDMQSSIRAVSSGPGGIDTLGATSLSTSQSAPQSAVGGYGSPDKYRGIRDLQENDYKSGSSDDSETERRKEGLLWALSRPGSHIDPKGLNKQAWHKYWVVLAGGQLCEYSNWKEKLDLHNEPINLKMASVREARNAERRFCFEVITPQYKRVYQATSAEDMNSWISSINNALKSTIESGKSVVAFDASKIETNSQQAKAIQSALTGKSHFHGISQYKHDNASSSGSNNLHRRTTVGARPTPPRRASSALAENPEKLLQTVREADPSNSTCADCGNTVKVEWVSINLGIVLCIECSGLHRSLGTHISKMRSLTLDTKSFTNDLIDLICLMGNKNANAIWEGNLEGVVKPDARASRETRLRYITQKYSNRAFVTPISPTLSEHATPADQLLDSVKRNDITGTMHALALRADPNLIDPESNLPLVYLALLAADPPSANTVSDSELSPSTPSRPVPTATFPLAELLLQNGSELPSSELPPDLSLAAKAYIQAKIAKKLDAQAPVPGLGPRAEPLSKVHDRGRSDKNLSEQEKKEKEAKLQKRISSGSKFGRIVPSSSDRDRDRDRDRS